VLPSTDLHLMGRRHDHAVPRGVVPLEPLRKLDVTCSIATNNVLNPFTPYGDGSLIRMANLYANVCHVSRPDELAGCLDMITGTAAKLLRHDDTASRSAVPPISSASMPVTRGRRLRHWPSRSGVLSAAGCRSRASGQNCTRRRGPSWRGAQAPKQSRLSQWEALDCFASAFAR
jgi:hypothetical protein